VLGRVTNGNPLLAIDENHSGRVTLEAQPSTAVQSHDAVVESSSAQRVVSGLRVPLAPLNKECLGEKLPISTKEYLDNRPSNFYSICISEDDHVCGGILTEVNSIESHPRLSEYLENLVVNQVGPNLPKLGKKIVSGKYPIYATSVELFPNLEGQTAYYRLATIGGVAMPYVVIDAKNYLGDSSGPLNNQLTEFVRKNVTESYDGIIGWPNPLKDLYKEDWITGTVVAKWKDEEYMLPFARAQTVQVAKFSLLKMNNLRNGRVVCHFESNYSVVQ